MYFSFSYPTHFRLWTKLMCFVTKSIKNGWKIGLLIYLPSVIKYYIVFTRLHLSRLAYAVYFYTGFLAVCSHWRILFRQ